MAKRIFSFLVLLIWDHTIDFSQYYNSKNFQNLQSKMKDVKQTQGASSLDCSRNAPCCLPLGIPETNQNTCFFPSPEFGQI